MDMMLAPAAEEMVVQENWRRRLAMEAGAELVEILRHIDRLTALLRPHCEEAALDMIDAGSEMISRAAGAVVEPGKNASH